MWCEAAGDYVTISKYLQDGKTLPTGPVVISPNGLFPSLFREGMETSFHWCWT